MLLQILVDEAAEPLRGEVSGTHSLTLIRHPAGSGNPCHRRRASSE
jgi:hypothetical protein